LLVVFVRASQEPWSLTSTSSILITVAPPKPGITSPSFTRIVRFCARAAGAKPAAGYSPEEGRAF